MATRLKAIAAALWVVGMTGMHGAHAGVVSLSGQYLDVTFDTAQMPSAFSDVRLVEEPFKWNCGSQGCTLASSATASIEFLSTSGAPVAMDATLPEFNFQITIKPSTPLVDPLGHVQGIAAADNGKWLLGANIAGQRPLSPDGKLAFGGHVQGLVAWPGPAEGAFVPTWAGDPRLTTVAPPGWPLGGVTHTATTFSPDQTGLITWGPGADGHSLLETDGTNLTAASQTNSHWRIRAEIGAAVYSQPVATCPSCMRYESGSLDVSSFVFSMAVTPTTVVPEPSTALATALGLVLMGCCHLRRRARA